MPIMMVMMMMLWQRKKNLIEGKARGYARLGSLHTALMELDFPKRVKKRKCDQFYLCFVLQLSNFDAGKGR